MIQGSRIGEKIGDLTLIAILGVKDSRVIGRFSCSCGGLVSYPASRVLNQGNPSHCGCKTDMGKSRTHGMIGSPEYQSWQAMKARCLNPESKDYRRYGARGITVCQEWAESFAAFFAHIGTRPKGTTVDRIDGTRGYEPGNVRWATPLEQARNRRDLTIVKTPMGTMVLVDYARAIGLTKSAAHMRLRRGTLRGVSRA